MLPSRRVPRVELVFGSLEGATPVVSEARPAISMWSSAQVHPFFERKGDNFHCTIPLTVSEAALGTKIQVPTIDGPATVRVPPGTQSGQRLRMRGKGAPSLLNPGIRGDQYVEVKVVVPRIADERSKEILRELARLNPDNPRTDLW